VRIVGALMFLLGVAGTAYATWAAYHRPRPRDVLYGAAAPVAFLLAVTGLLLVFVPGFFG
jgi:formate-dependent nitrite reductase membrane component NrfD